MAIYDAFLSYSHAKDKPIAAALQSAVQSLGKPWYRRRALRIFRDDASLSATPDLWPSIEQALRQSRFLILLASPEAGASPWVAREINCWLSDKSSDSILIGLTDGDLSWDQAANNFTWPASASLPAVLSNQFHNEPKWVDLRGCRTGVNSSDAALVELAANFAATIHGISKEDVLSQEVRQQRRALTLAWSATASIFVLAGIATWQWYAAYKSERVAIAETARAERNFVAAKDSIDSVVFDIAEGLRNVEGMSAETLRRILGSAESALGKLATRTDNDPRVLSSRAAMFGIFSDTYLRISETSVAAQYAQRAVETMRGLLVENPTSLPFQRNLAVTLERLASVLVAQGRSADALATHREAQAVTRALIQSNGSDTSLQHSLSIGLNHIGSLLLQQGKFNEAVSAFRESLQTVRAIAAIEPKSDNWKRSLSVSLLRLGEALGPRALSELAEALEAFQESLDITRELVINDAANTQFQRDLYIALAKIADVLLHQGHLTSALAASRESADVARALSLKDRSNVGWQNDLASCLDGVGHILKAQNAIAAALPLYRESLDIRRVLVAKDTRSMAFKRGLMVSLNNVGIILKAQGDFSEALIVFREAYEIANQLSDADPRNVTWQKDVVYALGLLAQVGDDPRSRFKEAHLLLTRLTSKGFLSPADREWLDITERNLAKLAQEHAPLAAHQIEGVYEGTNIAGSQQRTHPISLTFRQSGREVTAFYRTPGGQGSGTGILAGNVIRTILIYNQMENCLGSFKASFTFLGDTVYWNYSGEDCGGSTHGRGSAKKSQP